MCPSLDNSEGHASDGLRLRSSIPSDGEVQPDSNREQPEWVREQVGKEHHRGFTENRRDENSDDGEKRDEETSDEDCITKDGVSAHAERSSSQFIRFTPLDTASRCQRRTCSADFPSTANRRSVAKTWPTVPSVKRSARTTPSTTAPITARYDAHPGRDPVNESPVTTCRSTVGTFTVLVAWDLR